MPLQNSCVHSVAHHTFTAKQQCESSYPQATDLYYKSCFSLAQPHTRAHTLKWVLMSLCILAVGHSFYLSPDIQTYKSATMENYSNIPGIPTP